MRGNGDPELAISRQRKREDETGKMRDFPSMKKIPDYSQRRADEYGTTSRRVSASRVQRRKGENNTKRKSDESEAKQSGEPTCSWVDENWGALSTPRRR